MFRLRNKKIIFCYALLAKVLDLEHQIKLENSQLVYYRICLQFVIVVFPDYTHYLFLCYMTNGHIGVTK